jgi:hypothetical protein
MTGDIALDRLDALRIAAEDARAEYERACEMRYPSLIHGEPVEDLTGLLDAAEDAERKYELALGVPGERMATLCMTSSAPDYRSVK